MDIRKIGVIGAGQMGSGIAQAALLNGYEVVLCDVADEIVKRAKARIMASVEKMAERSKITAEEKAAAEKNLYITSNREDVLACPVIIEAVLENIALKQEIFKYLDENTPVETILATNTSSVSITEIASVTKHPERVIGTHFFNPVHAMKLLELIYGYSTDQKTIDIALALGESLGKVVVVSKDKAGFIVNRLLNPMLNEAIFLLEEGVGSVEDIDNGMKFGCNHPMGPLELADLIGLDVLLAIMEVLQREYGDPKYRPATLLKRMVRAGKLGKKTGEGFYKYENGIKAGPAF